MKRKKFNIKVNKIYLLKVEWEIQRYEDIMNAFIIFNKFFN